MIQTMDDELNSPATSVAVKYRRRLDRTPEKRFEKLPCEAKVLLSTLRGALEEAKTRIVRLRDENEEKDEVIDEERRRRVEAENRLQTFLVDLYNNPDVNSELRQRLPRAKKVDPLIEPPREKSIAVTKGENLKEEDCNNDEKDDGNEGGSESSDIDDKKEDDIIPDARNDALKDNLSQVKIIASTESSSTLTQFSPSQQSASTIEQHSADTLDSSLHSLVNNIHPHPAPSYVPLYPYTGSQINPLSAASFGSLASSSYHALPTAFNPGDNRSESDQRLEGQTVNENGSKHMQHHAAAVSTKPVYITDTSTRLGASQPPLFSTTQLGTSDHPYAGRVPPLTHVTSHFTCPYTPGYPYTPYKGVATSENVSHITRLLAEIASLKKENEQLKTDLVEARQDLALLKAASVDDGTENLEKVAVLIEEVHTAEKKKDRAVTQMVKSAEEDRNAVLGELDRMRLRNVKKSQVFSSMSESELSEPGEPDDGLDNTSGASVNSFGDLESRKTSLQHLELLVGEQREIMKQNLQSVIDQRDKARAQVAKLEKKVSSLELAEHNPLGDSRIAAKLRVVERERDMVVGKLKLLMQDRSETTLLLNLQKALLTDDPCNDIASYPHTKDTNLGLELSKNNNMTAEMTKQAEEKAKLEAKIALLEKEKLINEDQVNSLEQLVKRQRQKLNTLCAGPMLIDAE